MKFQVDLQRESKFKLQGFIKFLHALKEGLTALCAVCASECTHMQIYIFLYKYMYIVLLPK